MHRQLSTCLLLVSLAVFLASPAAAQALPPSPCPYLPILAYHHVTLELPPGMPDSMARYYVQADQFEKQLLLLRVYGYQAIGFEELLAYHEGRGELPPCPVILTFDDGAQDNYLFAYPLLQHYEMTATFFIPTGRIADTTESRQPDILTGGPGSFHMIWPEVQELAAQGFSIGSHTVNHANLKDLDPAGRQYELATSLSQIQSRLGPLAANLLAFPYGQGFEDSELSAAVMQAGYQAAVGYGGTGDGVIDLASFDPLALPRISILRDVSLELDPKNPWWFFMRRLDPDFPLPNLSLRSFTLRGPGGELFPALKPGARVEFDMELSNWGSEVDGLAVLRVRDGAGRVLFEFEESVKLPDGAKSIPITFPVILPNAPGESPYTADVSVLDRSGLLSYFRSGSLSLEPTRVFLPGLRK